MVWFELYSLIGWFCELFMQAQRVYGNRWTEIAKVVSGRYIITVYNLCSLCMMSNGDYAYGGSMLMRCLYAERIMQ